MGFRINTNIAALNAHTNATMNNRNLDDSLNKLSSGLRINTAADDASGLTIANSLRSQASSLGQAVSNGNDAVGLLQTADGALSEYANILDTIKTKSVQAASDGQNTASRLAIQKDVDALMEELNVIAKTTSFNGQKLLSGTFSNKEFQMGANANESVKVNIGSTETSQIGQTTRGTLEINKLGENQLTLKSATTGKEIVLEPVNLLSNNDAENGMGKVADVINKYSGETGITARAIVEVTTAEITAGSTGADFSINGINIGVVQVDANDTGGTLQNAINSKATETGITAARTEDGKLTLSSSDGRAINLTGDISAVTTSSNKDLSTFGQLDIVQAGSSDFQIAGADLGTALGADNTLSSSMITIEDSVLAIGSSIASSSTVAAGTTLGADITAGLAFSLLSSTGDALLKAGSTINSASTINDGTELGGKVTLRETAVLSSSMLVKAGSTLASNTVLDAGTVLNQDITVSNVEYKAGSTLVVDLTLTSNIVLAKDMTMFVDGATPNAAIGSASILLAGTVLGADVVVSGTTTVEQDMVLKAGSSLLSSSVMKAGSVMGDAMIVSGAHTTTAETLLKAGSTLVTASILKEASTIGGTMNVNADLVLKQDMLVKSGSMLETGAILKQGTVLNQDLTDAQVGGGTGSGLAAGTVLGTDITTTAKIYLTEDMTILKGTTGTDGTIKAGSSLITNAGNQNSVEISDKEFTSLADIDVTTLEGAMEAIDTLSAAISNLDTIRSGIGSAQNQVVSTINNISVTQVNVKAAESNIRDVDFAAESANFSKFNILAQSGSYAMSQANAVQQNVMRLLQ